MKTKKRIVELDFFRGILILLMLLQHFAFMYYLFSYTGIWKFENQSQVSIKIGEFCNDMRFGYGKLYNRKNELIFDGE